MQAFVQSGFSKDLRALIRVGWPLILNNLFSIGVNVADTLMVGRLGATQLAALSIGSSLWIGIFLGGLGILMALGPTVAQHFGAGREADIGHDTGQAIWLALAISCVVIVVMLLLPTGAGGLLRRVLGPLTSRLYTRS